MLRIPDRHLPCRASPVTATQRKDILPTEQLASLADRHQRQLATLAECHQRQLATLAESYPTRPPTHPDGQALAHCSRVGCTPSQSSRVQLHPFARLALCPSYIIRIPSFLPSCTGWALQTILIVCPFAFVWLLLFGRWSFAPSPVWANPTCALLGAYRLEHLSITICGLTKKAKKKQHNMHYAAPRRQAPKGCIMYIIFHFFAKR